MQSIDLIHKQEEVFIVLILHFAELSVIGLIGGFVSYILEYYVNIFKNNQHVDFDGSILVLHGILGAFASFIVLSMFPVSDIKLMIGLAALSGLSSVPLLVTLKSVGIDYLIEKMFGKSINKKEDISDEKMTDVK